MWWRHVPFDFSILEERVYVYVGAVTEGDVPIFFMYRDDDGVEAHVTNYCVSLGLTRYRI